MENNQTAENLYTAIDDKSVLTLRMLKEILNKMPENQLDFEMVVVDRLSSANNELRGIPISNIILDVEGKQMTIFHFVLRNKLRLEALAAAQQEQMSQVDPNKNA